VRRGIRQRKEELVWRVLTAVAESDSRITAEEQAILRRYRTALGVTAEARPQPPSPGRPFPDLGDISIDERIHLLRMMFRVAFADGRCSDLELRLLRRVAGMMGLSGVQFADVQVAVEQEARSERQARKWLFVAGAAILAAAVTLPAILLLRRPPSPPATGEDRVAAFKRIEREYSGSILLIRAGYDLVSGESRQRFAGWGSGFFVGADGLIATNKHVVQPWKFEVDAVRLLCRGYELDPASVRVSAWTSGSRFLGDSDEIDYETAFDSGHGTLAIVAAPDDRIRERLEQLPDGTPCTLRLHANDDSDLVLLRAAVEHPVKALRLACDVGDVEKLDPVMVLGFPTGATLLERGTAEVSPSLGEVRKIENSLSVSAPMVGGNSGGPVIDRQGRVIAVATRTAKGEATLGGCILSPHVVSLLESLGAEDVAGR